ncbi:hypothetical protein ACLB1R_27855 [Escherichia coli]
MANRSPLWTSEQGVGRNKQTYVTWQADCKENAGRRLYWTFPHSLRLSARRSITAMLITVAI